MLSQEDLVAGQASFQLSVAQGNDLVTFVHSFKLLDWALGLHQTKLLVDGHPGMAPVVYRRQEVAVSAVVTLEKNMSGAPEAFIDVRDASDASLLSQPLQATIKPHPRLSNVFAVIAPLALSRPGVHNILLAVRHPSRPQDIMRSAVPCNVVEFQ